MKILAGLFRTLAIVVIISVTIVLSQGAKVHAADSPDTTPLLLVHGFDDACNVAYNTPSTNGDTTINYLEQHGWTNITTIGFYHTASIDDTSQCDVYLPDEANASRCQPLLVINNREQGIATLNDPIQHLSCMLAWYIHDTYGSQPVKILAHSMGGLIVRDAIGQSGNNNQLAGSAYFPPQRLNVTRVVTVATPHGGISGFYATVGTLAIGGTEVADMTTTSFFMSTLMNTIQKPQGASGTFWGLMGASDPLIGSPCIHNSSVPLGSATSCNASVLTFSEVSEYLDGDGVVQASSQLAMSADYKILYGKVDNALQGTAFKTYTADTNTAYEHEVNTCINPNSCLAPPFYLNDNASDSQYTRAWICSGNCTAHSNSDFSDLNLNNSTPAWHSLAEIAWMLAPSTHANTGQVTRVAPSMAYLLGFMYTCWIGSDGHINVGSTGDGVNFLKLTTLGDTSNYGCSLAGFQNRLYLAFTGNDHTIYIESSTDGVTFVNHTAIQDTSNASAAIALFQNRLYLTFTGTNNTVYAESSSDGIHFVNHIALPGVTSALNNGPAINAFGRRLYVGWTGQDSGKHINLISSADGINFDSSETLSDATSTYAPALTNVGGRLMVAWTDALTHLDVESPPDGYHDILSDTSYTTPALAALYNRLLWSWSGTDAPSHLYIALEY